MQATGVPLPVIRWGRVAHRRVTMRGTWHFYTADDKFNALWLHPQQVPLTRCTAAVEPNFSTGPLSPRAVVLWGIYRKRWIARYWQTPRSAHQGRPGDERGVRIFVDLNVDLEHFDLALLGVPVGWTAYAVRGSADIGFVVAAAACAAERAQTDRLNFLVYGGGPALRDLCLSRGWTFVLNEEHELDVSLRKRGRGVWSGTR